MLNASPLSKRRRIPNWHFFKPASIWEAGIIIVIICFLFLKKPIEFVARFSLLISKLEVQIKIPLGYTSLRPQAHFPLPTYGSWLLVNLTLLKIQARWVFAKSNSNDQIKLASVSFATGPLIHFAWLPQQILTNMKYRVYHLWCVLNVKRSGLMSKNVGHGPSSKIVGGRE